MKKKNMIGVIGGMGPYASVYFYKLLVKKSTEQYGAKDNDDYPEIVIDSVPVPDFISDTKQMGRAKGILLSRVKALNNFGCSILAMACNTGHILYPEMSSNSEAPFISMIEIVCQKAKEMGMKRVGLMATKTTIKSGIYHNLLEKFGIKVVNPNAHFLEREEEIIRDVITNGESTKFEEELFNTTSRFVKKERLDGVILGCTELPLVFPKNNNNDDKIIDSLEVLADRLLSEFYRKTTSSKQ